MLAITDREWLAACGVAGARSPFAPYPACVEPQSLAGTEAAAGREPPAAFRAALDALATVRPRAEIVLEHIPAPQRLAPWAHALGAQVYEPDGEARLTQTAREHFGALTPLHAYSRPLQAMAEISQGAAAVGVLPMPSTTDTADDPWWAAMLRQEQPRLYIVARLPFWAPRPEGSPPVQALVIAATEPDASGHDRSLLGLELDADISRARVSSIVAAAKPYSAA